MSSYSRIPEPFIRAKDMNPKTFGTFTEILYSLGLPFKSLHVECAACTDPKGCDHDCAFTLGLIANVASRMRLYVLINVIFAMYNFYPTPVFQG